LSNTEIVNKIMKLKKERHAVILAHLYQPAEIQDIADFVGDSLELSRTAKETDADVIVFCGVTFMAETAKILSPDRMVLLPDPTADCPMANGITAQEILQMKEQFPEAAVVCYVNSSIEVKAVSDICCTSANAVSVVQSLPEQQVIFVPDQNLGSYIATFCPEKQIILAKGYCPTHHFLTVQQVTETKKQHPEALLLVHPECPLEISHMADLTGSTAQIIDYAIRSPAKEFIIATEEGILYKLKCECPDKQFYPASPYLICPNMKKTTLTNLAAALEQLKFVVEVDEEVRQKAAISLERMLALS